MKVNEKQQKEKEQKLEAAGMKLPAEFIKIGEDSDDHSDSSYVFDSDEYEKVLDEDNSEESDESDESGDDEEGSDDERLVFYRTNNIASFISKKLTMYEKTRG